MTTEKALLSKARQMRLEQQHKIDSYTEYYNDYEIGTLNGIDIIVKLIERHDETVKNRFSITKTILSDFALFAIIDNKLNKVVCHLVHDNGEQYCDEMANKMLAGLNGCG